MALFLRKTYLQKIICIFTFAFIFDSFAFGFEFKNEIQSKNLEISKEVSKFFSDIFDRDSEKEKDIFCFGIKLISLRIQFFHIAQAKEISHFFVKEIPFKQFSMPPPAFS